jgi:hypothetical protein
VIMQSESARMSSAVEARFRIDAPNSKPRAVKVIALDHPSERVVKDLSQRRWNTATFFTASAFGGGPRQGESFAGWLSDLAGRTKNLIEEIDGADLVVMVASAGEIPQAASIIGEACSLRRVMTTALVLGGTSVSDEALSKTLSQIRALSMRLENASAEENNTDMKTALRASGHSP